MRGRGVKYCFDHFGLASSPRLGRLPLVWSRSPGQGLFVPHPHASGRDSRSTGARPIATRGASRRGSDGGQARSCGAPKMLCHGNDDGAEFSVTFWRVPP
jgi:hypothetical protein